MEEDAVSQSKDGAARTGSASNWCEDGLFSMSWAAEKEQQTWSDQRDFAFLFMCQTNELSSLVIP